LNTVACGADHLAVTLPGRKVRFKLSSIFILP
jgi:hypothetical protein